MATSKPRPRTSPTPAQRARALRVLGALHEHYPDAHCELCFTKPHELLVATILSAQTTDVAVNKATPALFAAFQTPEAFAASSTMEIEPYIRAIGLFRMKARAVHESMRAVVERFGGRVPESMEALLTLRGVARKTANVVLGNCFGINEGFVVDTHVHRLACRLGLAPPGATVAQVERWLMAQWPRESWCDASHALIFHGRRACKARGGCCFDHTICKEFGARCELRTRSTPVHRDSG